MATQKYDDIRDNLNTGDIILFSGSTLTSWFFRTMTLSQWSHVGMVVKMPQYDYVALWESTTSVDVEDIVKKKGISGVQLVPLKERLKHYEGTFAVRHLKNANLTEKNIEDLMKFRKEVHGTEFDKNFLEWFKAQWDLVGGKATRDIKKLFCSELIAETYQVLGLLNREGLNGGESSNEYVPADFSTEKPIDLINNAYLTEEIFITLNS